MKARKGSLFLSFSLLLFLLIPLPTSEMTPEISNPSAGSATRSVDWWMVRSDYIDHILTLHAEGAITFGWLNITGRAEVLGLFWADPSSDTTGLQRDSLCKKRLYASQEAAAAYLNSALSNGEPLPLSWEAISSTLIEGDEQAIAQLGTLLAEHNGRGEGVVLIDGDGFEVPPSDRWGSQETADRDAADCGPHPIPPPRPRPIQKLKPVLE